MKQTAVEFLESQYKFHGELYETAIEQAKEMEEEQHQETFKQSRLVKIFEKDMPPVWESWEQYYNETFKSE